MYTLFLKYTIDPNKLADWRAYAEAEGAPITESGGRITGYYAPTEFAGATSEASRRSTSAPWPNTRSTAPNSRPIPNIRKMSA
jgi:hypothetical protein